MNNSPCLAVNILLLAVSNLSAATLYVSLGSTNPAPPYTNWATAATTIQDAVDAAAAGDRILVTNGVYATGGTPAGPASSACRVYVGKPVALLSVNGPQFTIIRGGQVINPPPPGQMDAQVIGPQCVTLTEGASLSGFTLTNGMGYVGGGVMSWSTNAVVRNCVIVGNSAPGFTSDGEGGGALNCTLYNCTLVGNNAGYAGGGAAYSTLYNCTLVGNSVVFGGVFCTAVGGAFHSTIYNCILYYNTVQLPRPYEMNYDASSTLNYCCTMPLATEPLPTNGVANIFTNSPLFVDYANGNLRLQSNSPCINAGNNAYVTTTTDLDGRPRIAGGTVDMGAYEFQPGVSGAFIGWLQQYGLPTDGSADFADADADGMNNWQEWVCGTCPTNPLSALRLLSTAPVGANPTVTWQSVAGVKYFLKRGGNLDSPFTYLATNILGQAGTTTYTDTNATGAGPLFYRVGVNSP
jgi:hypothetical protein